MVGLCKQRIKFEELDALIKVKQERLSEIESESAQLRAELVLLTNEMLQRAEQQSIDNVR